MELSEDAESIENYRRVQRDLATIYQVGNLLSAESDLADLYDRILDVILDVVKADRGFLLIANPEGSLETVAHKETSSSPGAPARLQHDDRRGMLPGPHLGPAVERAPGRAPEQRPRA